jgi:hypothetical protein
MIKKSLQEYKSTHEVTESITCDICGKVATHPSGFDTENINFHRMCKITFSTHYAFDDYVGKGQYADICPQCSVQVAGVLKALGVKFNEFNLSTENE